MDPAFPERFEYLRIRVADDNEDNLIAVWDEVLPWIHAALEAKGVVFVHCAAGVSRSVSTVIAYLLRYRAEQFPTVDAALKHVKRIRTFAAPNTGFLEQLHIFHALQTATTDSAKEEAQKRLQRMKLSERPAIDYVGPSSKERRV